MGIYSIFRMDLVGTYGRLFWSMIDRFILLSYGLRVWGFGGADLTWVFGFGFGMADWDGDRNSFRPGISVLKESKESKLINQS